MVESDLPTFYTQQLEPEATQMANFPSREHDQFMKHWANILRAERIGTCTILSGDQIAGNMVSWPQDGKHFVGYWLGRDFWGKGIATEALHQYLELVTVRPLYAYVAPHNVGSQRVLEKNGFTLHIQESEEFLYKLE